MNHFSTVVLFTLAVLVTVIACPGGYVQLCPWCSEANGIPHTPDEIGFPAEGKCGCMIIGTQEICQNIVPKQYYICQTQRCQAIFRTNPNYTSSDSGRPCNHRVKELVATGHCKPATSELGPLEPSHLDPGPSEPGHSEPGPSEASPLHLQRKPHLHNFFQ
ncbi:hypothetical protein PGT21_009166 [Puccinia graminis f. sp. tritici]|uniref:Uncharacterized protein n=1 Tax=Puccinia graminis f. sp. tritici TaxID=56615 RepID=A0A5B0NYH6_PUCGR|nr:hypothetical protein PGT21_009166 [Puccinia graminis f. sp. tritici]KAA1093736.1 hypothetical protein PGTUg99_024515 [Puccinia graminis f. sp. tritici]